MEKLKHVCRGMLLIAAVMAIAAACVPPPGLHVQSSHRVSGNVSSPAPPPPGLGPACSVNDDCLRGQICVQGSCRESGVGTSCQSDYDCKEPTYCILGSCRQLGNAGDACKYNNDCVAGMICSNAVCKHTVTGSPCAGDTDCNTPDYCIQGYCQPLQGAGGYCGADQDCTAGLVCAYGICSTSTGGYACSHDNDCIRPNYCILGACRPLGIQGETCQYNYDCEAGLICSGGVCAMSAAGSLCKTDNDCNAPNFCILGSCRPLSDAGGACGLNQDCFAGMVCTNGKCAVSGLGTPCSADADCNEPDYCIVGYCRPLSGQGGVCNQNGDCVSGLICSGTVCVQSVTGTPCSVDADCSSPDYCIVGYCRPLSGQGGVCAADQDCLSPLICQNGMCVY